VVYNDDVGACFRDTVTQSNNASTDATADTLTNIVVADNFVSTTPLTSGDYRIKSGSPLDTNGIGAFVQSSGGLVITTSPIASAESFGSPTITTGVVLISPVAIASAESVGSPVISTGVVIILPTGIPSEQFVGRPIVLGGASIVIPVDSRQTWNAVAQYLRNLVFRGQDNDVIVAWLGSEGFEEGAYNDMWYDYLFQHGFLDGSLTDKYAAWRQDILQDDPWLLSSGSWNDFKIWRDNENWRDS
jgi:large exoprotein involved in heme utilization and adhesion